jgi:hypothetical protein
MKFSQAISQVRWFSFVETNVSKTISVLVLRVVDEDDKDRDGLRNVGFYKTEPPYLVDSLRKLHYTHSPGKHQTIYNNGVNLMELEEQGIRATFT